MSEYEFTPDQIVEGINSALADGVVGVIPGLIKLLAVQDPRRAQQVLGALEIGHVVAGSGR